MKREKKKPFMETRNFLALEANFLDTRKMETMTGDGKLAIRGKKHNLAENMNEEMFTVR